MRYNSNTVFQQVAALGKKASFEDARNILDNVRNTPLERLEAGVGAVFGADYFTVKPIGGNWLRMEDWAVQTFGDPGSIRNPNQISVNRFATPGARWYMNDRKFWFRDEADRTMFLLRWS